MQPNEHLITYQIYVKGRLDERFLCWFEGLVITKNPSDDTIISGAMDQATLHGVLNCIRDLGLGLISVQQIPIQTKQDCERKSDEYL